MKTIIKKYFSMVEVALAIAILAVGAATVITLVPVGMKQTKESIGQNYSAVFADDTYSYLSSLAKQNWDIIADKTNGLPPYNDNSCGSDGKPISNKEGLFNNDGSLKAKYLVSSTNSLSKVPGTDIFSTNNSGVYAVAKSTSSRGEQDYAAQVLVWRGEPYSQSSAVTSRTIPAASPTPQFNISSGTVSTTAPVNVSLNCLGIQMQPLNPRITASVAVTKLDGTPLTNPDGTPFLANPPSYLTQSSHNWTPSGENAPVGTSIVLSAQSNEQDWGSNAPGTVLSTNTNQVWVLKNGDPAPTIPGYGTQLDLGEIVTQYTENGKIKLAENQVIYGFELYTKNTGSSAFDMQDLVILATLAPVDTTGLKTTETGIGISPTGSNYAFDLTKSDGTHFTRDNMQSYNSTYPYNQTFSANSLLMKTKTGDGAAITMNNQNVSIDGKDVTINAASSGSLQVKVWKDNPGMGQWYIQLLEGSSGNVVDNGTGDPVTPPVMPPSGGTTQKIITGVGINVEISWPLHQTDYTKRTKLRYYFEVYDLDHI